MQERWERKKLKSEFIVDLYNIMSSIVSLHEDERSLDARLLFSINERSYNNWKNKEDDTLRVRSPTLVMKIIH